MSLDNITTYGKTVNNNLLSSSKGKEPVRYGLNFPSGEVASAGYFRKISGNKLLMGTLKQLLLTEKGERVMIPNFGVNIRRFLFDPFDEDTFMGIREEVLDAIEQFLPTVRVLKFAAYNMNNAGISGISINLTVQDISSSNLVEVEVALR